MNIDFLSPSITLFFIPIISLATSMVTLVGMFYGAKRFDLINEIIYYNIKISVLISIGDLEDSALEEKSNVLDMPSLFCCGSSFGLSS